MNDPNDTPATPPRPRRQRTVRSVAGAEDETLGGPIAAVEPAAPGVATDTEAEGDLAPEITSPRRRRAAAKQRTIASYPARNVATIAGKELYTYFASPIAYLVIGAFLVMNGYLFSIILFSSRAASLSSSFGDMAIIMLFLSPAITMRLLSEEQRQGTIELLLTSPLREVELVLGKWLAAMAFFIVMLALTIPYPLFLMKFGSPDTGTILGGYIGMILLEGVFMAIGLLMSSMTQNQIIALAMSFGVLLVLWLLQGAGQNFGSGGGASLVQYIALAPHFDSFTAGNIQVKDLAYYASLIIVALFLSVRSIETRRWR
jgi:ABC-2 type transport system permease protein